jgi:hypothetical protein
VFDWRAVYEDKSEHPHTSKFTIANIDKFKLDLFQIKDVESDLPLLNVHFDDPRKRLIYVRRVENWSTLPHPIICHLVGWQMKVGKENIQNINYVFETIIVKFEDATAGDGTLYKRQVEKHLHWIETAGKFDRTRESRFYEPTAKQLSIIGSNPL